MVVGKALGTRQGDSVPGDKCDLYPESAVERGAGRAQGASGREYGAAQQGKGPESTMPHFLGSQWHRLGLQPGVQGVGTGEKVGREPPMTPV